MKKIFAFFAILMMLTSFVLAQEPELVDAQPELLGEPSVYEDDSDMNAGVTPDSFFYGLDKAMERISLALTFNKAKKAEKGLKHAEERLMEVKQMIEENKLEHAAKAEEDYGKSIEAAEKALEKIKDPEDVLELQNKLQSHYEKVVQIKNRIMERQRENMSEEQFQHMEEVFGKIMTNAQEMENKVEQRKEEMGKPEDDEDDEDEDEGKSEDAGDGEKPEDKGKDDDDEIDDEDDEDEEAGSKGKGGLDLLVSDAPANIADFDSLVVTFSKVRLFMGGKPTEKEISGSVDLTELVGEKAFEVLSTELDAGTYNKVEMYVSSVEAKVDGNNVIVKVPSSNLKITKNFEIVEGETVKFVFDINVVKTGKGYNLLPVISKSGVVGEDVDIEEVECSVDSDCEDLELCQENECESVNCIEDSDCETGDYCESNECIDIPECTTDEECTNGYCEDNECVLYACIENADCEAGDICIENECEEVTECATSEDCNGLFCLDSICSENECVLDENCAEGFECAENVCTEIVPECTVETQDTDCEAGFECVEGSCTETTV